MFSLGEITAKSHLPAGPKGHSRKQPCVPNIVFGVSLCSFEETFLILLVRNMS